MLSLQERLTGLLLGGAVGDALGLPWEGLSRSRLSKMCPGELRHRFFFGRGMISDDTEHAFFTAQALLAAQGDAGCFQRQMARQLRGWFVSLPAGIGWATGRSCLRLWLGVPAARSGVFSAGNGPAMRSAVLGAALAGEEELRSELVRVSTKLTHTDPRAERAARAVAEAAAWLVRGQRREDFPGHLAALGDDPEWVQWNLLLAKGLAEGWTVEAFAAALGLSRGVSGYAYHTVPVALFAWLRHPGSFHRAVTESVRCGGDTDTVGAIAGSLAGCEVGRTGIPEEWIRGLRDWPRSVHTLEAAAIRLAAGPGGGKVRWFWPAVVPRNLLFLAIVLGHGFRRIFPPY